MGLWYLRRTFWLFLSAHNTGGWALQLSMTLSTGILFEGSVFLTCFLIFVTSWAVIFVAQCEACAVLFSKSLFITKHHRCTFYGIYSLTIVKVSYECEPRPEFDGEEYAMQRTSTLMPYRKTIFLSSWLMKLLEVRTTSKPRSMMYITE